MPHSLQYLSVRMSSSPNIVDLIRLKTNIVMFQIFTGVSILNTELHIKIGGLHIAAAY